MYKNMLVGRESVDRPTYVIDNIYCRIDFLY